MQSCSERTQAAGMEVLLGALSRSRFSLPQEQQARLATHKLDALIKPDELSTKTLARAAISLSLRSFPKKDSSVSATPEGLRRVIQNGKAYGKIER
jgi:hypothetical protein